MRSVVVVVVSSKQQEESVRPIRTAALTIGHSPAQRLMVFSNDGSSHDSGKCGIFRPA